VSSPLAAFQLTTGSTAPLGRAAVGAAVDALIATGAAASPENLTAAVVGHLPPVTVSDVLRIALSEPEGREQFRGYLAALVSSTTGASGRLPADLILDVTLTPRMLSFGLPGGADDLLATAIGSHVPRAAFLAGDNPDQVEVIADIQNLRFDQLLFAEEAKGAYETTPAGERALWHFPPLEVATPHAAPQGPATTSRGGRVDGHIVQLPASGTGSRRNGHTERSQSIPHMI
jgi:hypothetical protein